MTRDTDKARQNAAKSFRDMANRKYDQADEAAYNGNSDQADKLRKHGDSLRDNSDNASKNIGKSNRS